MRRRTLLVVGATALVAGCLSGEDDEGDAGPSETFSGTVPNTPTSETTESAGADSESVTQVGTSSTERATTTSSTGVYGAVGETPENVSVVEHSFSWNTGEKPPHGTVTVLLESTLDYTADITASVNFLDESNTIFHENQLSTSNVVPGQRVEVKPWYNPSEEKPERLYKYQVTVTERES